MINLNKKRLTKSNLLEKVSDVDIYRHYIDQELDFKSNILSPLRREKEPSFGFFIGQSGEICFKDFRIGSGDCINLVERMYNLSFYDAMSKIVIDFGLTNDFYYKNIDETINKAVIHDDRKNVIKTLKKNKNIAISRRKPQMHDVIFWEQFGITKTILNKYRVEPIRFFFINDSCIKADKYAYAFIEHKDNKETYKIYQPFNKEFKWLNNHDNSVWQGWEQLPEKADTLIITKSLKDVMSINSVLNLPSTALQSEKIIPKDNIIKELKERFEFIHVLYDNDYDKDVNWGEEYSKKLTKKYNLLFSQIPTRYESKDFSDLVKNHGIETAKKLWKNNLCLPF